MTEEPDACGHCGLGRLEYKGHVETRRRDEHVDNYGPITWSTFVGVSVCDRCGELTVIRYSWADEFGEPVGVKQLYPSQRDDSAIPERVRDRLGAARRVKPADPNAYAVSVRLMLETVCNIEGAEGKDLFHKLDDLAQRERIPGPLADAAHQLREFGKFGAHDDVIDVDAADVPAIEDLAEAILEYMYRAPAKLTAVKESVADRQTAEDG